MLLSCMCVMCFVISLVSYDKQFPLHYAARIGDKETICYHLKNGTQVNSLDWDRIRPLHEACFHGHVDCVKLLLENDAMVEAPNIDGATPICDASAKGSVECVQMLLDYGANVNPPLTLSSPLHEAVSTGSPSCAKLLIDAGARLDASDFHYGTPLHVATFSQNVDCVRLLLMSGAMVNAIKIHRSALHIAANCNFVDVAFLLLEFGANVYMRDNEGRTAKELARPDSPLVCILELYEKTPKSLLEMCRWKVRQSLGPKNLSKINTLGLPRRLSCYLGHHL